MLISDIFFFFNFPWKLDNWSCALAATNRATNAKKNFMMSLNLSESDFLNQMIKVCEGPAQWVFRALK